MVWEGVYEKCVGYRILAGKHERTRSLEKASCRWEDNIKMDLKEILCESLEWINLAQDRLQ
jgi:hypothetical protein